MRKLYNEFFYIPTHGKIRDKVMLTRVVTTVIIILMCLAVMSVSAYAYFSSNITSSSSLIKVAHFETSVSIKATDSKGEAVDITPETTDNQIHTATLKAGVYNVTLALNPDNTAKTGFMILTAKNCNETYHTQQLGKDAVVQGGETKEFTFELTVTDDTVVEFASCWGTSSYYDEYVANGDQEPLYITNKEQIKMVVNGVQELPADEPGVGEPTDSEPETSEPGVSEPTADEPTADEPTADEPTTDEPTTDEPSTDEPGVSEPVTDESGDTETDPAGTPDQTEPTDPVEPETETETPETQPTTDGAETPDETTPSV